MLTTPVFTRIMPESEYGLTSTFFSLQSIVEIIGTLCVTSCAANLFVQTENKRKIFIQRYLNYKMQGKKTPLKIVH